MHTNSGGRLQLFFMSDKNEKTIYLHPEQLPFEHEEQDDAETPEQDVEKPDMFFTIFSDLQEGQTTVSSPYTISSNLHPQFLQ